VWFVPCSPACSALSVSPGCNSGVTKLISRTVPSAVLVGSLAIVGAALVGFAGSAAAYQGTPPPWAPAGVSQDANAVGGLEFFNSAGTQITGGSLSAQPFAAYTLGLIKTRTPADFVDTKATLFAYVPEVGKTPDQWATNEQVGLSTDFPITTGPTNLKSLTLPLNTGGATDLSLSTVASDLPNAATTAGYSNTYEIRMYTGARFQTTSTTYDYADISINTVAGTWTQVFSPSNPIPAPASTLSISAGVSIASGGITSVKITAALKVKSTLAPIAGATLTLKSRTSTLKPFLSFKTVLTSSTGAASYTVKPTVTTYYEWVYAGSPTHGAVTSVSDKVTVVPATILTIGKSVTIHKGKTTVIATHLLDARTHAAIRGLHVYLQIRTSTARPWVTYKTLTTSTTGAASYTVKPLVRTYYRWYFAGTSTHFKSLSATEIVTVI
jgi:hypothetical protein